ncbi:MAG TPA: ribose-phosphate pyrophosphokinase [Methylocystis sp.]|nr:ribose-phosphate pyrophosphokinase [Methylocystis sp.]
MTTMDVAPPALLRLFSRLDFGAAPEPSALTTLLEQWNAARDGKPLPQVSAVITRPKFFSTGFVFRRLEDERDYVLLMGLARAEAMLGPLGAEGRLFHSENRRAAVRLRRLFAEALRTCEPFVAQFIMRKQGREVAAVDTLVAPLSEDGRRIDSFLVGFSSETFKAAAPAAQRAEPTDQGLALFALDAKQDLAQKIGRLLHLDIAPHEERRFEDGEFKIRPLTNVRNKDVFVLSSLYGEETASVSDKLCRLLFFIGALKDAGACCVTLVAPYLCFQRKDRQTKPRDPVATRYLAQLLEAMGTARVMTIDAHNLAAYQNAFRCDSEHLDAQALFARHFARLIGKEEVAVVSPDLGGEKRAELFRERLERTLARPVGKAFMDKRRSEGRVTGDIFAGDVKGRIAIVLDDLISGGGTMARVAAACRREGAQAVWCAATHGVFSAGAASVLERAPIDRIVVTDSVPPPAAMNSGLLQKRLTIVSVASLLAQAIRCCHGGGSIAKLLEEGA